jgi:hypothetical protein
MKQFKSTYKTVMAFAIGLIVFGTCGLEAYAELSSHVYLKAQSLSLKEYDDHGNKITEESGALLGIGYKSIPKQDSTSLSGGGELYYGTVDYAGQLRNGVAVEDKNKYMGLNLHGNMNILIFESFLEEHSLMALGGLGVDCWIKSLSLTHKENGYREIWTNFYGRAGLGFYLFKNVYISGGAKIPLWTRNHIGNFGLNLNPKGKIGTFLEPTIVFDHLSIDLFYESNKFGTSDIQSRKGIQYNGWQPESVGRTIGISLRSRF